MPSSAVAFFPRGLTPPVRLDFSSAPPFDGHQPTPFSVDWVSAGGDIHLHFNPRPADQIVVLNSRLGGAWGEEVRVSPYPFTSEPTTPFRLTVDVEFDRFLISVDGSRLAEFPHRADPSTIREIRSTIGLWHLEPPSRARRPPAATAVSSPSAGDWVVAERNGSDAHPLETVRLFAVLGTWLEEDVIAAAVSNCLTQGCERVYLVDNDSPDATVARAVAAGATLARRYSARHYSEEERIRVMQTVVDEVSATEASEHIWWLWLDADEFPHGPRGHTIRDFLVGLDRRFRIVGARVFNHFPPADGAYQPGFHPLDFQPICYEMSFPHCALGHAKHPLQRWDREGPPIRSGIGFHWATATEQLLEPVDSIILHHFPFRDESVTRTRMTRLFGRNGHGNDRVGSDSDHAHLQLRMRSLDAVYRRQWEHVAFFPPCVPGYLPELKPWQDLVNPSEQEIVRWY